MGLFASRPEEPSEWAGIPSEPREVGSAAEHLDAPVGAGIDDLATGSLAHSILIPVSPTVEVARPAVTSGEGDEPSV
jgi:hypothetical protein